MLYYISYKGKKLGSPLTRQEAEQKLLVLSRCFKQLEIVKELAPPIAPVFIHGALANTK